LAKRGVINLHVFLLLRGGRGLSAPIAICDSSEDI
jgi:hypothetical protein